MINYIVYWQHDTPTGGHYGNVRECNIIYPTYVYKQYLFHLYFRGKPALQEFMIEIVRVVEQFQLCLKNTAELFVYRVVAAKKKKKKTTD